jgi:hypothetical protein
MPEIFKMKKTLLIIILASLTLTGFAQKKLAFPFKGGKEHMVNFFKDSLIVSQGIIDRKAYGIVVIKFSADPLGRVSKMVVYYADDPVLIQPAVDALKRSDKHWIIPTGASSTDYLVTFSYSFNPPAAPSADLQAAVYDYNINRKPITFNNESLVENGILLPTVVVNYDIPQ